MEVGLQMSPELGYPDSSDSKFVSGVSTILVATIQEAKDRISQIEYIFCSQLYPNFQSKYKSLQKIYSEAKKAAEETWKEKEKDFLVQMEKLQFEKQQVLEENNNFKILINSNEELMKELGEKNRVLELEVEELKWEVKKKSKENDGVREQQIKSLQLVQSKVSLIANKEKELKKKEALVAELRMEIAKNENLLNESEKENGRLKEEVGEKIEELQELQREKGVLTAKVDELQVKLREGSNESAEGTELHGKLLKQIEAKDLELISEKRRRRDVFEAYKKVKAQYLFLLNKFGLTSENMLNRTEDESNCLKFNQSPIISPGIKNKDQNASPIPCVPTEKDKNQQNILNQRSNLPSSSISPLDPKYRKDKKSSPLSGSKRPASHWRDTRSHQSRIGPDPHDDFLDTPLENVRGNSKKPAKEVLDVNLGSSEDETQDIGVDLCPPKPQMVPPRTGGPSGFKYVEPVRKKAERENLKGIECKQCKKFYDAVLPDGGGGNNGNSRCEHHDGVSRHRYRFEPPLTPEGFWNIGFESEM